MTAAPACSDAPQGLLYGKYVKSSIFLFQVRIFSYLCTRPRIRGNVRTTPERRYKATADMLSDAGCEGSDPFILHPALFFLNRRKMVEHNADSR